MKKYQKLSIFISAAVLLFSATIIEAQQGFPKGKWWNHPQVIEKLNITEKQIEEIEQISYTSRKEMVTLKANLELAQLELDNLLDQDKVDIKAVEKQIDVVAKARASLEKERIIMLVKIKNILPEEAVKKLKALRGYFGKDKGKKNKTGKCQSRGQGSEYEGSKGYEMKQEGRGQRGETGSGYRKGNE